MEYATLWKRILNEGIRCVSPDAPKPDALAQLASRIVRSKIIVDTRVHDMDKERGMPFDWRRYTRLPIPFEQFWIEGAMIDHGVNTLWGTCTRMTKTPGKPGWWAMANAHVSALPHLPPFLMGLTSAVIDPTGALPDDYLKVLEGGAVVGWMPSSVRQAAPQDEAAAHLRTSLDLVLDVLLMLGCRNVSLASKENDPKQVRRAMKWHGGSPDMFKYHTLVVRPPGARHDSPGIDIGVMPRHLCRGHFAEYGPEFNKGLLFGKHAGRFFIPPHLKGDRKNGVVEKDYVIPAA